jgi:hypothetical protein
MADFLGIVLWLGIFELLWSAQRWVRWRLRIRRTVRRSGGKVMRFRYNPWTNRMRVMVRWRGGVSIWMGTAEHVQAIHEAAGNG